MLFVRAAAQWRLVMTMNEKQTHQNDRRFEADLSAKKDAQEKEHRVAIQMKIAEKIMKERFDMLRSLSKK